MEEKDNVVQARFREPTNIEAYIEDLQQNPPDTIFSVMVSEGNLYYSWFGISTYDEIDGMIGKLERAKEFLLSADVGDEEE